MSGTVITGRPSASMRCSRASPVAEKPVIVGDHTDHALHAIGQPGAVIIFVPVEHKERALQIIAEARENGYLDAEEGELSVKPV